ncbi:hypothetical protein Pmani_022693 [Petrolisthes manimaculis]|uniref:Ion transport domain-containing protein n=1 Tax=Petrolisthes manimaculis TaxID=1843537 RepID=A0AAE1U0G7_9EUCA|nr:hypothetical protein Pmani_022693 [Petrolisthes manimaculis]
MVKVSQPPHHNITYDSRQNKAEDVDNGKECERLDAKNSYDKSHLELQQIWTGITHTEDLVSDGICFSRGLGTLPSVDEMNSRDTMPNLFRAIYTKNSLLLEEELEKKLDTPSTSRYGGRAPIHAACYAKNLYALIRLINHDVKIETFDQLGHTALHVAVAKAWHDGVRSLLELGASPNILSEPPATIRGVKVETPFHIAVRNADLVSVTLMMQKRPDLSIIDSNKCSVLHLASLARSVEIIRLFLKEKLSPHMVTSTDKKGNSVLHRALQNPCDSTEEVVLKEVVDELVNAGADVNASNPLGESPLYLAAKRRLPQVVQLLLNQGADPTQLTKTGQSVLHAACQEGCASCLTLFIQLNEVKNMVTLSDSTGHEPFDYAVLSGSIDCCELVLKNGDHLTRVDKDGISRCSAILKHLPSATELLKRLFDANVLLANLSHHDAEYRITFDYTVIYKEADSIQSSLISELSHSRLEALLKHPLLESFLFFKWSKIKPFFYCSVLLYMLFLLLHTSFIIMTFGGNPWHWREHTNELSIFLILHITMFLLILIPDIIIMVANFKKYLSQWETFSKAVALCSSAFVIFSYVVHTQTITVNSELSKFDMIKNSTVVNVVTADNMTDAESTFVTMPTIRRAATISVFFSWVEFMMLLGRFPSLGSYVLMFTRVAHSIIKFLVAFSSLIIGFGLSFMVLFPHTQYFDSFPRGLVKTLMMMIGEIDYENLQDGMELPVISNIFLVLFLFLVCVLMANLLIGLAVNDIPDLQRQGKIKRLSKQASYLVSFERLMKVTHSLCCFPKQLRKFLISHCKVPKTVAVRPNKETSRKNLYHLPSETLHEAMMLGTEDSKIDFPSIDEEEDLVAQFRSFKIKYARDRRLLHRRLAQLPDTTTTETILTKRLDQMEQMLQNQLFQLSLQLQQRIPPGPSQSQQPLHAAVSVKGSGSWKTPVPQHSNPSLQPLSQPTTKDTDFMNRQAPHTRSVSRSSVNLKEYQVQQQDTASQPTGIQNPNIQQSTQQLLTTEQQNQQRASQQFMKFEQQIKSVLTQPLLKK